MRHIKLLSGVVPATDAILACVYAEDVNVRAVVLDLMKFRGVEAKVGRGVKTNLNRFASDVIRLRRAPIFYVRTRSLNEKDNGYSSSDSTGAYCGRM